MVVRALFEICADVLCSEVGVPLKCSRCCIHSVLLRNGLPELGADSITTLPNLNDHNLSHKWVQLIKV